MIKKTFMACGFMFLATVTAHAQDGSRWHTAEIQGFTKYWTENTAGDQFIIWCHPTRNVSGTLFDVVIEGARAPAGSLVRLVLEKNVVDMPSDQSGYIQTASPTGADSFRIVWHSLRSALGLSVTFEDGRQAGFSLVGARQVLPRPACPADFNK